MVLWIACSHTCSYADVAKLQVSASLYAFVIIKDDVVFNSINICGWRSDSVVSL